VCSSPPIIPDPPLCDDVTGNGRDQEDGVARNSRELARRPAVDPRDQPSVEWGWHGGFPNGKRIAGVFSAIFLLLMLALNPHPMSFTEIIWLVAPAALIILGIAADTVRRRHAWRR
jgi:hypothetical protein